MLFRSDVKDQRDRDLVAMLRHRLGYTPRNLSLYKQAMRHRSAAALDEDSNERMEFLGDAVLDLVVGELVYLRYPTRDEGYLTQMRSRLVSRETLNKMANDLGFTQWIEMKGSACANMAGNMFEALVGAIYLDLGFIKCRQVMLTHLFHIVDWQELECTETDYKSRVVERCQKKGRPVSFRVTSVPVANGKPALFRGEVLMDGHVYAVGEGHSKKDAEQEAARQAWLKEFNFAN